MSQGEARVITTGAMVWLFLVVFVANGYINQVRDFVESRTK